MEISISYNLIIKSGLKYYAEQQLDKSTPLFFFIKKNYLTEKP